MKAALLATSANIRAQLVIVEQHSLAAAGLTNHWDEYIEALWEEIPRFASAWINEQILQAMYWYDVLQPKDVVEKYGILLGYLADAANISD